MGDRRTPRGGSRSARQDDGIQNGLEEWESEAAQLESSQQSVGAEDTSEG